MEPDDRSEGLRRARAEVDERAREQRLALHALRTAGIEATSALKRAGFSSAMVARGIGASSSTVRKLTSDGSQHGWRPRSLDVYAAVDELTLAKLGTTW